MKLKILLSAVVLFMSVTLANAQLQDSAKALKKQQEILNIEKRLVDNKLKLESLQKSWEEKSTELDKTLNASQESANSNKDAAEKLQDNSMSKKDSRKAEKAASRARKAAKRARKAESRKSGIESDIKSLEKKINKDEEALAKLRAENS